MRARGDISPGSEDERRHHAQSGSDPAGTKHSQNQVSGRRAATVAHDPTTRAGCNEPWQGADSRSGTGKPHGKHGSPTQRPSAQRARIPAEHDGQESRDDKHSGANDDERKSVTTNRPRKARPHHRAQSHGQDGTSGRSGRQARERTSAPGARRHHQARLPQRATYSRVSDTARAGGPRKRGEEERKQETGRREGRHGTCPGNSRAKKEPRQWQGNAAVCKLKIEYSQVSISRVS